MRPLGLLGLEWPEHPLLPLEYRPSAMKPHLVLLSEVDPHLRLFPEPVNLRAEGLGKEQQQVSSCIQLCFFVVKPHLLGCFHTAR
jgi:hypothetical protein